MFGVTRKDRIVSGRAEYFRVVLDQDAVVEDGDRRFLLDTAVVAEDRRVVDDVVGLPFAGFAAGVDQRRVLFVNRAGLAVEVGLVIVRIEHLDFVAPLQEDSAVSTPLAFANDLGRRGPFDVQLDVVKFPLGSDGAGSANDDHRAVLYIPFGRTFAIGAGPVR